MVITCHPPLFQIGPSVEPELPQPDTLPAGETPAQPDAEPPQQPEPEQPEQPAPEPAEPQAETFTVETIQEPGALGTLLTRAYTLENGDSVRFSQFTAEAHGEEYAVASLPRAGGTVQFCAPDGDADWQAATEPGVYVCSFLMVDYPDGSCAMAYVPQSWALLENGSRRFLAFGSVELTETEIRLRTPALVPGQTSDFTLVQSDSPLIRWDASESTSHLWATYRNAGQGRWCYDGYYWPSPVNYIPTGKNVYYRLPAAYLCKSMVYIAADHRLAWDLSAAMLDVMAQQQNAQGFFPTLPGSEWLLGDYEIGPGFYDTRFNTDLMRLFVRTCRERGLFKDVLVRYADFYTAYAASHHRETVSGGWLIDDYYHPDGNLPTHTSLNHQLAEIILLYELGDVLEDPSLTALAERLLLAITDTADNWLRDDGNLHYAVYADGSYGGTDYPYLTYNDLFEMQQVLEAHGRTRSTQLQALMDSKRRWMDANGVTGYLT